MRVRVPIAGSVGKTALVNTRANRGARIGTDLLLPDGSAPSLVELAEALYAASAPPAGEGGTTTTVGGELTADGNEIITGNWQFRGWLRVANSAGVDYLQMSHDGTDFDFSYTQTANIDIFGATGAMRLLGIPTRFYDALQTDYLEISHDGTDANLTAFQTTDLNITGIDALVARNYNFDVDQAVGAGQDNYVLTYDNATGQISLEAAPGAGGGEANTMSNQGAGVGVYDSKVGVDLRLRSLVAASTAISITLDDINDEIDFDVVDANIDHDALNNFVANEHIDWTADQGSTNIHSNNIQVSTTNRFLGRQSAGAGAMQELDAAAARGILNVEDGATADQTDAEIETAYNNQVQLVSQAEAEAGTATTVRRWTAQRVAQAIAALETAGIQNVVEDTTPELGGELNAGGNDIRDLGRVVLNNNEFLAFERANGTDDATGILRNSLDQLQFDYAVGSFRIRATDNQNVDFLNSASTVYARFNPAATTFLTDTIGELTAAAGVTVDGLLIKDSGIPEVAVTAHEAAIDHDALTNFVASEHIDWTADQGATNLHRNNVQLFGSADTGAVPASGGGTANFLRADGTWAAPGGGGVTVWKAKGNLSSASFDDTENVLPWANFVIDGGADVTLAGTPQSDIEINTTGTYKFTVTLRTDNSNRTELFIRTYIDTGSGYTQDTDEIVSDYVSRDNDQDTGSVTLVTVLALDDGDLIEFRGFGDTDGTSVGLDAGTVLIVERLA